MLSPLTPSLSYQQKPIFHIPDAPSLGSLQQFPNPIDNVTAYPIGNSWRPNSIPNDAIATPSNLFDFSFLANETIFNHFHLPKNALEPPHSKQTQSFNVNTTDAKAWNHFLSLHLLNKPIQNAFGETISLNSQHLQALAEQLAQQAAFRAPWMSIADFVNRRLLPKTQDLHQTSEMGALQSALQHIQKGDPILPFLSQADLLTILSPYLTVRSDTLQAWIYAETPHSKLYLIATLQRTQDGFKMIDLNYLKD